VILRGQPETGAGGMSPTLGTSIGELELACVVHGRFDGVDQGRRAVMDGGAAMPTRKASGS
jgi:hypothetical protein